VVEPASGSFRLLSAISEATRHNGGRILQRTEVCGQAKIGA
jgi:hypothetical protein